MGWGTSHHSITPGVSHRHPTGRRILPGDADHLHLPRSHRAVPVGLPDDHDAIVGLQRRLGRPEAMEPRRRADDDDAGLAGVEDNNQIRSARHHDSAAVDVASLHRHPAYRRRIAITGLRGQHQASRGNQYNRDSDKMSFAPVSPPQLIRTLEGEGSGGGRKNVNGCRRVTQGSLGLTQPLTAALEKPPALYQVRDPVVFACTQRCYGPRRGGTLL